MTTLELTATSVQHRLRLVVDIELPSDVPDGEHRITVAIAPSPPTRTETERDRVRRILLDAGVILEPVALSIESPVSPERLAEIAEKLAGTPSLSDIVIADREDRV